MLWIVESSHLNYFHIFLIEISIRDTHKPEVVVHIVSKIYCKHFPFKA